MTFLDIQGERRTFLVVKEREACSLPLNTSKKVCSPSCWLPHQDKTSILKKEELSNLLRSEDGRSVLELAFMRSEVTVHIYYQFCVQGLHVGSLK